jgi:phosphoribosylanthranilate isomerase
MTVKIKNCGLKTPQDVACAVISGASFIGFVYHAASPRHLSASEIQHLMSHVPPDVARVIVLVEPSDELLLSLPKPDFWQIHGVNDPARIHAIETLAQTPVITGIRGSSTDDLKNVAALEAVSAHLLFDAAESGSGQAFDWSMLNTISLTKSWFLAGGLNPANVAEAIRSTHAPMVDVSSGIEDAPGIKSLEKIAAFNAAVLHALHA